MQVIVNDLVVTYHKTGEGPLLVMLHGWADSSDTFKTITPLLERQFTVIRMDLAGFGGSQPPPIAWGLREYATHVRDALQKIAIMPNDITVLLGHSNGGAIAVTAIANGMLQPKKLILLASAGIRNRRSFRKISLYAVARIGKIATLVLPVAKRKAIRARFYTKAGSDLLVAEHMQATFKKIIKQDILASAEKVHVPTLLLYGELDAATPLFYGQLLQHAIEGSEMRVIQNAGHFLHQDYAEDVYDYIRKFTT